MFAWRLPLCPGIVSLVEEFTGRPRKVLLVTPGAGHDV